MTCQNFTSEPFVDHTSPTARFRFRASNASSNADGVCGDDAMQAEHCNDIIPCPIENATYNVTNTSCSEDCPEITCRDSEVKSRKEGNCCMTCQAEIGEFISQQFNKKQVRYFHSISFLYKDEGSFHACAARSEIKNFSLDGCESRDINITYCAGYCHSSVHVIPYVSAFFIYYYIIIHKRTDKTSSSSGAGSHGIAPT